MASSVPLAPDRAVPIIREKNRLSPEFSFALAMAASYYAHPFFSAAPFGSYFAAGFLFLLVLAVGFLRTLYYVPHAASRVYKALLLVSAAAVGFSFGVGARRSFTDRPQLGFPSGKISAVSGILSEDPRALGSGSGLGVLRLVSTHSQDGGRASAKGSVTVFFPDETVRRLKEFGRGCEIYADGVFARNGGESARGLLFRADSLHVVKAAPALESFRTVLRQNLLERFRSREGAEPALWSGLASALLLGVRDDLEGDLSAAFRDSGCSHVLALSGMHLAVLSGLLAFLLKKPLGIRLSSLVGAVFIVFYVFVAGSQPSLVRAAIMYLLGTFAIWGLLKTNALSLLSMAFIIQLCAQSETGLSYSFILSYLSLGGILTLGELCRGILRGRLPALVSGGLSASLGAFIATAPLAALFFSSLRPIGILAGLIIAPLSSLFMITALAALASGFLPLFVWNFFDFLLSYFYRFIKLLVSLAGQVPGFSASSPIPVLTATLILSLAILAVHRRDNLRRMSVASFD